MYRFAAILLTVAFPVVAQTCPVLEFAEMEAMRADELLPIRCQYRDSMIELTGPKLNQGTLAQGHLMLSWAYQCGQQMDRIDRVLGRKYGLKATPEEVSAEIIRRCRK